jgi:hypothetical protein
MKKILTVVAVLFVSASLVYLFIFSSNSKGSEGVPTYNLLGLPESPRNATYQIEGNEVLFLDGNAEFENTKTGEKVVVTSIKDPVFGDMSGDGLEDAALLLTVSENDATAYYVALALNDDDGYLGINAVRLDSSVVPDEIRIQDEIVVISYSDKGETLPDPEGEKKNTLSYVYMTLLNVTLQSFVPQKETDDVYTGEIEYVNDVLTFTSCESGSRYPIAQTSNSLVALDAIYKERASGESNVPVYIVLSGSTVVTSSSDGEESVAEGEQGSEEMFEVSTILSAPKAGQCRISKVIETEVEAENVAEKGLSPDSETETEPELLEETELETENPKVLE